MNRYARRIFLYSSIILFFIVAPTVIAYALGYSFDWETKKLALTGGFYFQSVPKRASVFINGKLQEEKTPLLLKRVIPQYYQIKVEKEGYSSWEKNLKVDPKIVTAAKDILLIPLRSELKLVDENLPKDFSLADSLADEDKTKSVFYFENGILYQTDSTGPNPEQISLAPLAAGRNYNLIIKDDWQIALISENQTLYLFNQSAKVFELIAANVCSAQFSKNNRLLYFTDNEIWVYNGGEKELITRSSQRIDQATWYLNEHIIFAVGPAIKIVELDGRHKRNIFNLIELKTSQIATDFDGQIIYLVSDNKLFTLSLTLE